MATTQAPVLASAIKLDQVSFSYGSRLVLDNVSMDLKEKSFLGLIGPNGAGKTVFLKIVTGLLTPDRGTVRIFGKPPSGARGLIGYVPQYASFERSFPIRVLDVVRMGRLGPKRLFQKLTGKDAGLAREALDRMAIADLADRQVGELSGGQLQRVLIARALASKTKILILDEPTASLDSKIGRDFYERLGELAKEMTVVLVSHDIGVLNQYVSVVACLNRELHYHGTKEITREMVEATYGCEVDFIVHDHTHAVLGDHDHSHGHDHDHDHDHSHGHDHDHDHGGH